VSQEISEIYGKFNRRGGGVKRGGAPQSKMPKCDAVQKIGVTKPDNFLSRPSNTLKRWRMLKFTNEGAVPA